MKKALLIASLILLAFATSVPNIAYTQSYPTFTYSAFPNDTCSKLILTKNYIFRLGANNVVTVNNKSSLARVATMTNYTYTTTGGILINQNLINDFDVDQNQTYITIAQTGSTKILNLMSFSLKLPLLTASFFKVLFSNNVLSGAVNNITNDIYFQVTFSSSSFLIPTSIVLTPTALTNVKDCKLMQSPNRRYHVYWDQYSNVFVYNATNTSASPVYLGKVVGNSSRANLTQTISFSSDSRYFIIEADNALPVRIVSLIPASLLAVKSFSFNGTINKAMFLDSQNAFIVLFGDTTATFFQVSSLGFLYSQAVSLYSQQIEIDYLTNLVYVCRNSSVQVYRTGTRVVVCGQNCQRCVDSLECLACVPNYILQGGVCVVSLVTPSSPSSPSSLSNPSYTDPNYSASSASNSTDSLPAEKLVLDNSGTNTTDGMYNTSTSTDANNTGNANDGNNYTYFNQNSNDYYGNESNNSGNNTDSNSASSNSSEMRIFLIMIMPDGTVMRFELTDLQAQIVNSTQQALKFSNDVLEKTMVYLSSSPLIYLALGNLQFFTISSIYTLLNVPIPEIIQNTLNSTAYSLNANMFTILKISLSVPLLGIERVTSERLVNFGVSSLFLPNNYQYMILSSMAIFVFFGMRMILRAFPQSKTLYYFLDHNKSAVIFGLVLSGMTGIILPCSDVYQNSWSLYFEDKINQIIQFLMIGLVWIFGALYMATVAGRSPQKSKHKEKLKKVQAKQKQLQFMQIRKEMDNIYLLIMNLSFPISVIFSNPYYFLLVNQVVLLFGFYIAKISTRFRLNKIVLSIYPLLFHFCFFIFNFSRDSSILIYTQITCILLYFIGSIHELLTIFFQLCYFLYKFIRMKMYENRVQQDPNDIKLQLKKSHTIFTTTPSTNINSPPRFALKKKVNLNDRPEAAIKKERNVKVTKEGDINVFRVNLLRLNKKVPENKDKRKEFMDSPFSWRNNRKVDEG